MIGECPSCGSINLEYGSFVTDEWEKEDCGFYPIFCSSCGYEGKEIYSLEYEITLPKAKRSFTVYFLTPHCSWEVVAKDEDDAISKCQIPAEFDMNEPHKFMAIENE